MNQKILVGLVFLVFLGIFTSSVQAVWSTDWTYYRVLTITNNNDTETLLKGTAINFTIDTTGDNFLDNGTDFRVIFADTLDLPRVTITQWNSTTTIVSFRLQENIPAGGSVNNYSIYYANAGAGSSNEDWSSVYLGGDATFTTSTNWTENDPDTRINITNGKAYFRFDKEKADVHYLTRDVSGITTFSDFRVTGVFNITDGSADEGVNLVCVSNFLGACDTSVGGADDFITVQYFETNNVLRVRAYHDNSNVMTYVDGNFSKTTAYWFLVEKFKNNISVKMFTDEFETQIGYISMDVNGTSGDTYDYVTIISDIETGGSDPNQFTEGWIDDVRFSPYVEPPQSVTLGGQLPTVDNPPTFSLNQTNSSYGDTDVLHSLFWSDDVGLDSYIFSFDNGQGSFTNDSAVAFIGGTSEWSNVTKHTIASIGSTIRWQVYVNDTGGNWKASDVYTYITTGIGNPTLTVSSPTNTTYYSHSVPLNVGADQTIDVWWYSLNHGSNTTFSPNISLSLPNGVYTIDVYANNTLGEEGKNTVFFTVDVLNSLTISSPTSITYTSIPINLIVSTNGTATNLWYSFDGGTTNVSFTSPTTLSPAEGDFTLNVWANNSAGTIVGNSVTFTYEFQPLSPTDLTVLSVLFVLFSVGIMLVVVSSFKEKISIERLISIFVIVFVGIIILAVAVASI